MTRSRKLMNVPSDGSWYVLLIYEGLTHSHKIYSRRQGKSYGTSQPVIVKTS